MATEGIVQVELIFVNLDLVAIYQLSPISIRAENYYLIYLFQVTQKATIEQRRDAVAITPDPTFQAHWGRRSREHGLDDGLCFL